MSLKCSKRNLPQAHTARGKLLAKCRIGVRLYSFTTLSAANVSRSSSWYSSSAKPHRVREIFSMLRAPRARFKGAVALRSSTASSESSLAAAPGRRTPSAQVTATSSPGVIWLAAFRVAETSSGTKVSERVAATRSSDDLPAPACSRAAAQRIWHSALGRSSSTLSATCSERRMVSSSTCVSSRLRDGTAQNKLPKAWASCTWPPSWMSLTASSVASFFVFIPA
mmetsp:Transcript_28816/g.73027  ORF Transcript_28816/g.73027 Transcript_28816/m.73027 type:complete len:224 (-) Transcript_28816:818-1489(-)